MAKIRKAVFRSGITMLSLLAAVVLSSSVAYAQDCGIVVSSPTQARAEGMTEVVGDIELRCVPGAEVTVPGFGTQPAAIPDLISVTVELNAGITNEVDAEGNVEVASDNRTWYPVTRMARSSWTRCSSAGPVGAATRSWIQYSGTVRSMAA